MSLIDVLHAGNADVAGAAVVVAAAMVLQGCCKVPRVLSWGRAEVLSIGAEVRLCKGPRKRMSKYCGTARLPPKARGRETKIDRR